MVNTTRSKLSFEKRLKLSDKDYLGGKIKIRIISNSTLNQLASFIKLKMKLKR